VIGTVLEGRIIFGIRIVRRLSCISAAIFAYSRFSGRITLREKSPKKHSERSVFSTSSAISGSCLSQEIVRIFFERVISISSSATPAIGAMIIIDIRVSTISSAICAVGSSLVLGSVS
jgi:hypothetical protein